jgi:hypothetical protein
VPLSAAQRRQNPEGWLGRIENKLETSIGGGGVIHKQREKAAEALQEFATKNTPDATGSPMAAGEALTGGITRRTEQRRRVQEALYSRAERLLDPDAGIDLPSMRQLLADVQKERASGGLIRSAVEDSNLQQLERALMDAGAEDADASFRSLKAYRTRIGEQIKSPLLQSAGSGQGNLKRIYGAASDDRANAAFQLGGAQAREAWSKADRFTRALETDLKDVDKLTKGTPAEVFRRFERAMLRDPTKAKQMLEAATPKARERVLQEVIYRLGRAKPGAQDVSGEAFSPATFATNWAKLKQEAPEVLALFTAEQRRALATLSQVSDSLKAAMKGRNTSRTAATTWTGAGAGAGGVGGALGGVGGALEAGAIAASVLAAVGGTQWLAAKALTSQGFAKALGDLDPKVFGRPMGDLLKALSAAGASEADVNALRTAAIDAQHGMPADRPPAPPKSGIGVSPRGALQ